MMKMNTMNPHPHTHTQVSWPLAPGCVLRVSVTFAISNFVTSAPQCEYTVNQILGLLLVMLTCGADGQTIPSDCSAQVHVGPRRVIYTVALWQ